MFNPMATNNFVSTLQQFNQFKQYMADKDPEAIVNELLRTGRMTPQQYEQLKQQAQTVMQFLS